MSDCHWLQRGPFAGSPLSWRSTEAGGLATPRFGIARSQVRIPLSRYTLISAGFPFRNRADGSTTRHPFVRGWTQLAALDLE